MRWRSRYLMQLCIAVGATVSGAPGCMQILELDKDFEEVPAGTGGAAGAAGTGGSGAAGGSGGQGGTGSACGAELCDGMDNDCDGDVDEDCPCVNGQQQPCYTEDPGTMNLGACRAGIQTCNLRGLWGDCDGEVGPSTETCNRVDDDCDGQVDEALGTTTCGLGSCQVIVNNCIDGEPQTCTPLEPASTETCDGTDDDCDGKVDEGCDCTDGSTQPCYSGPIGTAGVGACLEGLQSCVDGQWGGCIGDVLPSTDVCDGTDNDCDGGIDENLGNTICGAGICEVTVRSCVNGIPQTCTPGTPGSETCNGLDDDCDGIPDDGDPGGGAGCITVLPGACSPGTSHCQDGALVCVPDEQPSVEICDGVDNDCNGSVDDASPGGGVACSSGLPGVCAAGTTVCLGGSVVCDPNTSPSSESCDGLDNDCDGTSDEDDPGGGLPCNTGLQGVCGPGTTACSGGAIVCNQDEQPSGELCNASDDNCNGVVDDGPFCCPDNQKTGDETDVDCGGSCPQKCGDLQGCVVAADCQSGVCKSNICQVPVCGDAVTNGGEVCDDGNTTPIDGCSTSCMVEAGWSCVGSPSVCSTTCGDGIVAGPESCDDGDTNDGDNCSPTCHLQVIVAVDAGSEHTCALLNSGAVKCWGYNFYGQLGLSDQTARGDNPNEMGGNLPAVDFGTGEPAAAVSAGKDHSCAILYDGSVKCWGSNADGELGLGDTAQRLAPASQVNLGTNKTAAAIATSWDFTCAILNDATVKCWGINSFGQLGLGDILARGDAPNEMGDSLAAVDLGMGMTAMAVAMGVNHTCAILDDGSAKCWGSNAYGQLGQGDVLDRGDDPGEMGMNLPSLDLGSGKTATGIAAGNFHTCAILNDGTVKCWGRNNVGQLGLGDTVNRGDDPNEMGSGLPVVNLGAGKTALAIAADGLLTCALLNDNTVKCWGWNGYGQLGIESTTQQTTPSGPVGLGTGKTSLGVAVGSNYVCSRLNDGSLKCWGRNSKGQLGLGDILDRGDQAGEMGNGLPITKLFSSAW